MKKINFTKIGLIIKLALLLALLFISCKNDLPKEKKNYYANGKLKSIELFNKKGQQEGENKYFSENGLLNYINTFNNGALIKTSHFYDNGKVKYNSFIKEKDTVTAVSYFKNGNIKSDGTLIKNKKIGWWKIYDPNGRIKEEYEFLVINDKQYTNQIKIYDSLGNINESKSSFFEIILSDTLVVGKNAGSIKYYSVANKKSERHLYVIIDNEYDGGEIKKDTFFLENNKKNRFGIYAYQSGYLKVKGVILDRELEIKEINKDSSVLRLNDHYKYFEKQVYVK